MLPMQDDPPPPDHAADVTDPAGADRIVPDVPDPSCDTIGIAAAVGVIGVSRDTIRRYQRQGKLFPVGNDERGAPIYRVADLLAARAVSVANEQRSRLAGQRQADSAALEIAARLIPAGGGRDTTPRPPDPAEPPDRAGTRNGHRAVDVVPSSGAGGAGIGADDWVRTLSGGPPDPAPSPTILAAQEFIAIATALPLSAQATLGPGIRAVCGVARIMSEVGVGGASYSSTTRVTAMIADLLRGV